MASRLLPVMSLSIRFEAYVTAGFQLRHRLPNGTELRDNDAGTEILKCIKTKIYDIFKHISTSLQIVILFRCSLDVFLPTGPPRGWTGGHLAPGPQGPRDLIAPNSSRCEGLIW